MFVNQVVGEFVPDDSKSKAAEHKKEIVCKLVAKPVSKINC
jgi:hypothetical protein